jgi:SAM-dependent methyltransferase
MTTIIGATHEFHNEDFAQGWAQRFQPTPARLRLFQTIYEELEAVVGENGRIVELGIGPGYLAEFLLARMPNIHYVGVDFSQPMLTLAQARLSSYSDQVQFIQADLITDAWWHDISPPIKGIVTTWALHDLGSPQHTAHVYQTCHDVLPSGALLLDGDFIKPDQAKHEYEPGRFEIAQHLQLLRQANFQHVECLLVLEQEIENPTAAHNYACFKAIA